MSDLSVHEFEDITWDDLCQSDDHIVPRPHSPLCHSQKKSHCEITNISHNTEGRSSAGHVDQGSEGQFLSLSRRKNKMLERDSMSHTESVVLSSSSDGDSIKRTSSHASEKTTSSSHVFKNSNTDSRGNEFCVNNTIIDDKITGFNNSTDPLGEITHADSNLSLFENTEVKDSSDSLYYSWLDIENFEDVDRMFRSCDSTFGLGVSKEDDAGWFLSSDSIGGTSEIMNSEFKFSCPDPESNSVENPSTNHDSLKNHSSNDAEMMSAPVRLRDGPWISEIPDSYESFMNEPAIVNGEEGFIPNAQVNKHQKLAKLQNNSHKSFSSVSKKRPQHVLGPDSCNYLQNHLSSGHPDSSPLSGLTSVNPTSSTVKTETNELTSPSTRDSSHASNLLTSTDCSHDPPLPVTAPTGIGNREKSYNHRGSRSPIESNIKPAKTMVHATSSNPRSMEKEAHFSGDKSENHSDIEEVPHFIPTALGSSDIHESSSFGSGDISHEATSFHQLQLVMEQLDLRTKICIRDSLYRLARSAEQRHNLNRSGDGRDASGVFITEGEKNFLDIETDTNPIDRSVAHLLFHRPSESSPASAQDSVPLKSPRTVQGCVMNGMTDGEETGYDTKASDD